MMEIKILGTGCSKCKTLTKNTEEAVTELNLNAKVNKVEDIVEIMNYNVMSTPALVIDGKVVSKGKLLSTKEVKELLTK
ncbi:thioredoxin family protein [Saccharicrinis aurantiacus]|uniref:thioredoxin family protein n=1 Tax=Saccharicrinis aurantiacus TaxID=1849719 RepID=UPI001FE5AB26|nr:thioredoxin family protein [Saccharicrinis aurantiacus]